MGNLKLVEMMNKDILSILNFKMFCSTNSTLYIKTANKNFDLFLLTEVIIFFKKLQPIFKKWGMRTLIFQNVQNG